MKIVFDPAKHRSNRAKHGIDMRDAKTVFEGVTVEFEDARIDYGERRMVTVGFLGGR